jgi:tRNA A-37 threonylcarbamoyl transferase component Bud32/tetratricopeptide (TPR) repeat protein
MDPFKSESSADETEVSSLEAARNRRKAGAMLGRYVLLDELGRGGMSVVYVAYDPELDRRVALKVVRGDKLTLAHRARLHREAQALARLSHPNVVTVFDVGDLDDDTFVAMELVEGMDLRVWQKQPRTWREVVRVMVTAGRGLAAAHAAGIVHRDVKPHNILIGTSGVVKLVDFGLARDLGDRSNPDTSSEIDPAAHGLEDSGSHSISESASKHLETITQAGHVVGTPAYMPPEQRARKPEADERSDQFSFCVTLYEALYRQRPYQISRKELLDRGELLTKVDRPGVEPRTLAQPPPADSDVPAWLRKVVLRGLAAEPRHRYPSVEALLVDLDRDPERARRRVLIGAAAAVAVAGTAAFVTWKMAHAPAAAPVCSDGTERVAQVWGPGARDAIARGAERLKVGWADGAVAAFSDGVDRWADGWKTMHLEACTATRVRGEQSEEALDLRMACLDRRLREMGALVGVMRDADVATLRNAGDAVANLPPVADCGDVAALRAVTRAPSDPTTAKKVDALDGELARLSALYAVGNVSKTLELADRVIAEARTVGYAPTLARALYWRGRAIADRDGGPEAEAAFDETFAAALGAGDDKMAADAAARISQEELWAPRLPDFERWSRIAHALSARVGATDLVLWIDQLDCMANFWTGKMITRLACLRDVAARRDKANLPSEWLMTTLGVAASEAGDFSGSIGWLERGVQMAASENGADHPRTLEMRAYLCHGLNELGDYARSAKECGDALEKLEKVAPDDKQLIARLEDYVGEAEAQQGHVDRARPLLEAAIADGDDEIKSDAHASLGDLAGARGDLEGSVAARRTALEEAVKQLEPFNPHHPNIIGTRHELGAALLAAGKPDEAAAELTKADAEVDVTEISPLELAQIRFARAKAVAAMHAPDLALARRLAESARDLYTRNGPDTQRWRGMRDEVDAWLAGLEKPRGPGVAPSPLR